MTSEPRASAPSDDTVERLRAVLQEVVRTAAECRRYLSPGLSGFPYRTYRKVWDESFAAEAMAEALLKETLDA